VLTAYTYLLDPVGNRTQVSDYAGKVTQYGYSPRNELLQEVVSAAPLSWESFTLAQWLDFTSAQWADFELEIGPSITYSYDNAGNRQTVVSGGATSTYMYDVDEEKGTRVIY
jgi:hypothetical protein